MTQPLQSNEVLRGVKKFLPTSPKRSGGEGQHLLHVDGTLVGRVTIPRGSKNLKPRTFKSICAQAGLSDENMREAAACRFGHKEFTEAWRKKLAEKKAKATAQGPSEKA